MRPVPDGYIWVKSVGQAKDAIRAEEKHKISFPDSNYGIELISSDHDAGDYASDGGDYIRLLDWLEETGRNYPIRIHTANPVGAANMRAIIERNGWKEVK